MKLLRVYNPPVTIGGPHSVKARAIIGCRDIVDTGQPIQNRSVVFGDDSGGCNAMCTIGVMHPIREFQQVSSVLVASKDREAGHCLIAKHLECGFCPVRLAVSANHVASKIYRAGAGEAATRQRGEFFKEAYAATQRAVNLCAILFFVLGGVGIFQFLLANQGWPQDIAEWVTQLGLSPVAFLALLMIVLLALSTCLTGVAVLVLVVPVIYPVSITLGIDPIHLGILFALCIEMGAVIPPVGLNLFAVSGTTNVPVTTVMRGSFPFLCTDGCVLVLCLLIPALVLWLPNLVVQSVFG